MIWAFENDTSAIIKKLAKKSVKFDRKKNLFCLIAIIVAVSMVMMSLLTVQNIIHQNQTEVEELHQGIFFDITENNKEKILSEEDVKSVGLSCNIQNIKYNSKELSLIYYDDTMFELVSNFEGKYPQNKNEIAVTDAFFTSESKSPKLNSKVKLNINGRTEEFIVVGILLDENTTTFPIFVSKSKCQELRGNDLLNGYVWLENADTLSKDEATEILSQISENTGLNNWTISGYYDYVNAQISFSNYLIYGIIALILFLASALVIYSIFYISVGQKVAEYGQLRTIGASKKQIYKIVLKEGYMLAIPGIIIGCIIGSIISYCLQSKGWSFLASILSLLGSCIFGLLLVYISVHKPAKIASNVSPISALKNQVEIVNYRKHKSHNITPLYLAKISLSRNRKKSLLTILSMSLCGIIFFLSASYQSSFNAESMARSWDMRYGDFKISVDLENDSEDLDSILRKEYFSDYVTQVKNMEGVQEVFTYSALPTEFSVDGKNTDNTLLLGYNEKDMETLNKAVLSGKITDETELVVSDPDRIYDVYHWKPQVGDTVSFSFQNYNGETITKELKIGAITSSKDGMGGYLFRISEEALKKFAGYDCTYAIEIQEKPESYQTIEQQLRHLIVENKDVQLLTLEEIIAKHQSDNSAGFTLAYTIAIILWIFATINQINLTITNLLAQKKEMGILKSIGMTDKQLKKSFIFEGLFIIMVAIFITCIIGIPGGYIIGTSLKNAGMSTGFVFPLVSFSVFVIVMVLIETLLTVWLIRSWKKQPIIEIIRN